MLSMFIYQSPFLSSPTVWDYYQEVSEKLYLVCFYIGFSFELFVCGVDFSFWRQSFQINSSEGFCPETRGSESLGMEAHLRRSDASGLFTKLLKDTAAATSPRRGIIKE